MRGDPFGAAAGEAAALGACPVGLLDDWYSERWDFDSLCGCFRCPECVATPEDLGCEVDERGNVVPPRGTSSREGGPGDWEIGF